MISTSAVANCGRGGGRERGTNGTGASKTERERERDRDSQKLGLAFDVKLDAINVFMQKKDGSLDVLGGSDGRGPVLVLIISSK